MQRTFFSEEKKMKSFSCKGYKFAIIFSFWRGEGPLYPWFPTDFNSGSGENTKNTNTKDVYSLCSLLTTYDSIESNRWKYSFILALYNMQQGVSSKEPTGIGKATCTEPALVHLARYPSTYLAIHLPTLHSSTQPPTPQPPAHSLHSFIHSPIHLPLTHP